MTTSITVMHRPTIEQFRRQFLSQRLPVLVTGVIDSWPAVRSWNLAYLKQHVGKAELSIETYPTPIFQPDLQHCAFPSERMTLAEYTNRLATPLPGVYYYAAQVSLSTKLPALMEDIRPLDFHPAKMNEMAFWLGPNGTGTHLHYDPYDNVMAVISGAKRFVLFSPGQFDRLYPYPAFSRWGHFSQVNLNAPDLERFPKYAAATPIECVVASGQALFLPHGWWHYVVNEDLSIAVNFFYRIPLLRHLTAPMLRFHLVAQFKRYARVRTALRLKPIRA